MAEQLATCVNITIKRNGPPIERIQAGSTEDEAAKGKKYVAEGASLLLLAEVFGKVLDAIHNKKPRITLNISDEDGITIIESPTGRPPSSTPPKMMAAGTSDKPVKGRKKSRKKS